MDASEQRFLKRRKIVLERGLAALPAPEHIEDALPPFSGQRPEDGDVDSLAPGALDLRAKQAHEARPWIENWQRAVPDIMESPAEGQSTKSDLRDSDEGSLCPWDSLSASGQPRWLKNRIEKYRPDWERYG